MMQIRYSGQFLSRSNVTWRVDILQESDTPFPTIGELSFDAEDAVTIEWDEKGKEDPISGSVATLEIISPGDRTYEDLYTVIPGAIRCDIYRNGGLYWRGCLDPEFYEEPYEQAKDYNVSLTFSDFGILERLKFNLGGMQTTSAILQQCVQRAGLGDLLIDKSMITTTFEDGQPIIDGGLSVRSENFYDEDGEPMNLKETLEGILQPLGIRMIQRNGSICLYDLHGLYTAAPSTPIEWNGDSQTLGVDKVANNVKITFSPYGESKLLDGEIDYKDKYAIDKFNLVDAAEPTPFEPGYGEYYSYKRAITTEWNDDIIDFTVFLSLNGSGLAKLSPHVRFAHFLPVNGDTAECDCVMVNFREDADPAPADTAVGIKWMNNLRPCSPFDPLAQFPFLLEPVMVTKRVYLPRLTDAKKYLLRIQEEILIDAHFSPFSDSEGNLGENNGFIESRSAWVFLPARINLYDADGKALYHYVNDNVARQHAIGILPIDPNTTGYISTKGYWSRGEADDNSAWLEYYANENQAETSGINPGWKKNRQCIGRPDQSPSPVYMSTSFLKMEDGEYIPYPPVGGYLEIKIYPGIVGHDFGNYDTSPFGSLQSRWHKDGIYNLIRWMAYKSPVLEVLKADRSLSPADVDDIEYHGTLNKDARDPLEIDTVCGSSDVVNPCMRGVFYRTANGLQIDKLTRAGRTDHPEKLLIGTMYSQFADRKTILSGECTITPSDLCRFSEQNQGDKTFMMKGEVQNLIQDTSAATFVELAADEYKAVEDE